MNTRNIKTKSTSACLSYVQQEEVDECAIACLVMLCNAYRVNVGYDEVKKQIIKKQGGASIFSILATAKALGIRLRAIYVPFSKLSSIRAPSILYWRNSHFVVLNTVQQLWLTVYDPNPNFGIATISLNEAEWKYSGIVLEVMDE